MAAGMETVKESGTEEKGSGMEKAKAEESHGEVEKETVKSRQVGEAIDKHARATRLVGG